MFVSSIVIDEIKRIVKESEIMKYGCRTSLWWGCEADGSHREDDAKWPTKNKDGRQELEIRLGNDHISFEVNLRRSGPLQTLVAANPCADC